MMTQLRQCCNHPFLFMHPRPDADPERIVNAAGKLQMLDRMLPKLQAAGHRVAIFSQFTPVLDILEDYLILRKYAFVRLDVAPFEDELTMTHKQRTRAADRFNKEASDDFVCLMSAAGLSANLMGADTVILYEPTLWNMQVSTAQFEHAMPLNYHDSRTRSPFRRTFLRNLTFVVLF